eukprot:442808-Prymnesium_polylepis.1
MWIDTLHTCATRTQTAHHTTRTTHGAQHTRARARAHPPIAPTAQAANATLDRAQVIEPSMPEFPLVGQFVSLLLCVGHITSVKAHDQAFIDAFSASPKWLSIRDD